MAQLTQCPNGHYYDPDMYSACPYCSGASTGIDRCVSSYDIKTTYQPGGAAASGPSYTSAAAEGGTVSPDTISTMVLDTGKADEPFGHTQIVRLDKGNKKNGKLEDGAQNAQNCREEEELPLFSVVGWLVAVEGPYIGKSFEIHHAYNYIGRDKGDIVLSKDRFISGEKNAWVMYSDKNNRFSFGAGESTNVVYVNDEELRANSSVYLQAFDQIEIGKCKFRFVPFCGEHFQW